MTTQPLPLLIDCDPGVDDFIAILLALASREFDIRAIVSVCGNVSAATGAENALKALELAGREDIPVHCGCETALLNKPIFGKFHGTDGLGGLSLPAPRRKIQAQHAVEKIADELRRAGETGEPITVCTQGPLTNLAMTLRLYPELTGHIRQVVSMGGAFRSPGNRSLTSEFNILADPHAAQIVFSHQLDMVVLPLDATHQALVTPERIRAMSGDGRIGRAIAAVLANWDRNDVERYGARGGPLHDPLVIAWLVAPALFEAKPARVFVETASPLCMGQTVADWYQQSGEPANVRIVTGVDAAGVFSLLADRFRALDRQVGP